MKLNFLNNLGKYILSRLDPMFNLYMKNYLSKNAKLVKSYIQTLEYIENNKILNKLDSKQELLKHSLNEAKNGLFLEFGVYSGKSINYIAKHIDDNIVYGFDSFEGLPEEWRDNYPKGKFHVEQLPKVEDNVVLVKGWFDKTLEAFLNEHEGKIAFIHMDADLYSSTKYVLETILDYNRVHPGTVIQFDEFMNYPSWETNGEYLAFREWVEKNKIRYDFLGYVHKQKWPSYIGQQISIKIKSV